MFCGLHRFIWIWGGFPRSPLVGAFFFIRLPPQKEKKTNKQKRRWPGAKRKRSRVPWNYQRKPYPLVPNFVRHLVSVGGFHGGGRCHGISNEIFVGCNEKKKQSNEIMRRNKNKRQRHGRTFLGSPGFFFELLSTGIQKCANARSGMRVSAGSPREPRSRWPNIIVFFFFISFICIFFLPPSTLRGSPSFNSFTRFFFLRSWISTLFASASDGTARYCCVFFLINRRFFKCRSFQRVPRIGWILLHLWLT